MRSGDWKRRPILPHRNTHVSISGSNMMYVIFEPGPCAGKLLDISEKAQDEAEIN